MAKGVKMDCVRTLYLYRMATANTPAWFLAKRDASLSSRYYYIILHYYSGRELRFEICVTFTFAGFLLFSVMPRDCVAEIESAAPLDTPNVLKMHRSSDLHLARERKFAGMTTILHFRDGNGNTRRFASLEHTTSLAYIQFSIQYPTTYTRHVVRITILLFGPLRGHCRYKPVNRNVKYRARPVPRFCTENGCELNTFSSIYVQTASLFCTLFKTDYDGNVTPLATYINDI